MQNLQLAQLFFAHEGKLTDKWEQYLGIYQGELQRFIAAGKPVRLLEIGVQNGGSLEVWSKFLPPESDIVGIDIDPAVGNLVFTDNIRVFVADINDVEKTEAALGPESFDVIVDDGSHTSSDIIATFQRLFPRLAPGGKYIVEDLHCSYWKSHEGGLRLASSSIEYFKGVIDTLHADYIEFDDSIPAEQRDEMHAMGRKIARVAFYDSVCVIEKLPADKEQPYRHMLSGHRADVNDPTNFIMAAPTELIRPWIVGDITARSIDMKLKEELTKLQAGFFQLQAEMAQRLEETKSLRQQGDSFKLAADQATVLVAKLKEDNRIQQLQIERLTHDVDTTTTFAATETARSELLAQQLSISQSQLDAANRQLDINATEIAELDSALKQSRSDYLAIVQSRAWRVTAGPRALITRIRHYLN